LTSDELNVVGVVDEPFKPLADVFAHALGAQNGGGAALTIVLEGKRVVDLYGGTYRTDSLQFLFSVTKALTAICAAVAMEAGQLDLDEPISEYWPEMRKASTRGITPRMILSHRSGLASMENRLSMEALLAHEDEEAIALQEPYWEPGSRHGYHSFTFGTLMNSIFQRRLGYGVGDFLRLAISKPLQLDLWIGTPKEEMPRVIPIESPSTRYYRPRRFRGTQVPDWASGLRRESEHPFYNEPAVLAADWPAVSGVGSARALAAIMSATLDGRLLTREGLGLMIATQSRGMDEVLGILDHFGSGLMRPFPLLPFIGSESYGHDGGGGCVAFADREFQVAVGWTSNVIPRVMGASPGFALLLGAIRECLMLRTLET